MNRTSRPMPLNLDDHRITRPLCLLTIFVMALTGFGQMPIYKRYYMSDIPGFGWLADFYITRYVHYLGAAMLLALLSYLLLFPFLVLLFAR